VLLILFGLTLAVSLTGGGYRLRGQLRRNAQREVARLALLSAVPGQQASRVGAAVEWIGGDPDHERPGGLGLFADEVVFAPSGAAPIRIAIASVSDVIRHPSAPVAFTIEWREAAARHQLVVYTPDTDGWLRALAAVRP
jgi:hypothetical protein